MATNLSKIIKRSLQRSRFFALGGKIVVATSTGVDSMVLLTQLQALVAPERLVVAHVNHHLRAQSDREAAFLRDYCARRGLLLRVADWQDHPHQGIEAAARAFRYRFFAAVMKETGAKLLLTAHHANDQAETVLMKLVRGGDLRQLVGLRERRPFAGGELVRPLLAVPKAQLVASARDGGMTWFEDATNADQSITRNRYRHRYLPELAAENPQLVGDLGELAAQLGDLLAASDDLLAPLLRQLTTPTGLDLAGWWQQSPATQRLLLRAWLAKQGVVDLSQAALCQLQARLAPEAKPNQVQQLAGGWRAVRAYERLAVKKGEKKGRRSAFTGESMVKFAHWYPVAAGGSFLVQPAAAPAPTTGQPVATFVLPKTALPLRIRPSQLSDRLRLKGGGWQPVRRVLINQKVPAAERPRAQLLVDQTDRPLWLVGYRFAWWEWPPVIDDKWQKIVVYLKGEDERE